MIMVVFYKDLTGVRDRDADDGLHHTSYGQRTFLGFENMARSG